jgi:hypothetical protein
VGSEIANSLSIRRFTEFGANHVAYNDLLDMSSALESPDMRAILQAQLESSVDELEITEYQISNLKSVGLMSIGDVLRTSEEQLVEKLDYVGPVRARRIKNEADAAVLEYLSG